MDDARCWAAIVRRDAAFDNAFVYCVKSTHIYCRPTCKARLARRVNVTFCETAVQAEAAGFRPCKRCQPELPSYHPEADKVKKACDLLQALPLDAPLPGLERLAQEAGLTKHHFHRLFKREVGSTPKEYALACRSSKASESTVSGALTPITPGTDESEAPVAYGPDEEVDLNWPDFVTGPDPYGYDLIGYTLDDVMTTAQPFEDASAALFVYYGITETTYGNLLVAFKGDQVCKLELGKSEEELIASLEAAFPSLYYIHSHISLASEEVALTYRQRIDAVAEALQFPLGPMADVPSYLGPTQTRAPG